MPENMPSMPRQQHLRWTLVSMTSIVAVDRLPIAATSRLSWSPAQPDCTCAPPGICSCELVDVVGDAPPRLVLAEVVRQVDVDGLSHMLRCRPAFSAFQAARSRSMIRMMRCCFVRLASLLPRAAAAAQPPAVRRLPVAAGAPWDPAAPYITAGQDEPGYRSWYLARRGARRRSSRSTII